MSTGGSHPAGGVGGPRTGDGPPELVEVHLLGVALAPYQATRDHGADLMREFELLQLADHTGHDVPARLVALSEELTRRFSSFTAGAAAELAEAEARGEESIDLVLRVPAAVGEAARRMQLLLEEADEYCRSGQELLTLAPSPEVVSFRTWFLQEIVSQAEGARPVPWPEFSGR